MSGCPRPAVPSGARRSVQLSSGWIAGHVPGAERRGLVAIETVMQLERDCARAASKARSAGAS